MAKMFYEDDAELSALRARRVAVLGYGSQGHAHALCLRDSRVGVTLSRETHASAAAFAEALSVGAPEMSAS